MRAIYYYQNFTDLSPVIKLSMYVYAIYISSIHFGTENNGDPYIHLNDNDPSHPMYNMLWNQSAKAQKRGINVFLMVGGAGYAYKSLFSNFTVYYPMLLNVIHKYNIQGIDLDVEESVELFNIKMLIRRLRSHMGKNFTITMAPLLFAMTNTTPGLGSFSYKELYNSAEGREINWFNVQSYGSYTVDDYAQMVNNGYPPNKLVFGMISGQFDKDTFYQAIDTLTTLRSLYSNFAGVFNWEYCDSWYDTNDPVGWAVTMSEIK